MEKTLSGLTACFWRGMTKFKQVQMYLIPASV